MTEQDQDQRIKDPDQKTEQGQDQRIEDPDQKIENPDQTSLNVFPQNMKVVNYSRNKLFNMHYSCYGLTNEPGTLGKLPI